MILLLDLTGVKVVNIDRVYLPTSTMHTDDTRCAAETGLKVGVVQMIWPEWWVPVGPGGFGNSGRGMPQCLRPEAGPAGPAGLCLCYNSDAETCKTRCSGEPLGTLVFYFCRCQSQWDGMWCRSLCTAECRWMHCAVYWTVFLVPGVGSHDRGWTSDLASPSQDALVIYL